LDQKERNPARRFHQPRRSNHGSGNDGGKRRRFPCLKQTWRNPWEVVRENTQEGTEAKAKVQTSPNSVWLLTAGDLDGMFHLSDLSWGPARRRSDPNT